MLIALVASIGAALAWQRRETIALRRELAQVHASTADLDRLRAENRRLRENPVSRCGARDAPSRSRGVATIVVGAGRP